MTSNQMFMLVNIIVSPVARNPILHPNRYIEVQKENLQNWIIGKRLSPEEIRTIRANLAGDLDPELRKTASCGSPDRSADRITEYDIEPDVNERFGAGSGFGRRPAGRCLFLNTAVRI